MRNYRDNIIGLIAIMLLLLGLGVRAEAWSAIESRHFVVMHNESKGSAQEVQKIAEDFYPKVTGDIGYLPKRKITIWFCRNQKEFGLAINAPIQDWAVGSAYPQSARIVVLDPSSVKNKQLNLSRLIKHEITHIVFGLYLGDNLRNVPRWFNEGVAMYEAGEWSYGRYWVMLTASLGNRLLPLSDLAGNFPRNENDAQMAYAQSCSVITFIASKYGEDALKQCIGLLAEGRDMDLALAGSIGMDSVWLERKWRKKIRSYYKWTTLITSWIFIWGLIFLVLIMAYWRRKVKSRRIVRQWEEEDDFWWDFEDDEEIHEV